MEEGMAPIVEPRRVFMAAASLAIAGILLSSCGDETTKPETRDPGIIPVTSVAELVQALETSVPGDTLEIRAEFSSPRFQLTEGFSLTPDQSPITIVGAPRQGFFTRPEIIVPPGVDAFTFTGHQGSTIKDLDFSGGRDAIRIVNSDVDVLGLNVRNKSRDGVTVTGSGSTGRVEG
jgi:hypothetical protein